MSVSAGAYCTVHRKTQCHSTMECLQDIRSSEESIKTREAPAIFQQLHQACSVDDTSGRWHQITGTVCTTCTGDAIRAYSIYRPTLTGEEHLRLCQRWWSLCRPLTWQLGLTYESVKTGSRRVKGSTNKVTKPSVIVDYTTGLGGVDLLDQLCSSYRPTVHVNWR